MGGYGITYRGTDTRLDRSVAVKEYFPSLWAVRFAQRDPYVRCANDRQNDYAKGMERFLDEAKRLVQLSGVPGVVRVHDYFEENGTAYLVMDYLDGKNLKQMADGFGGRIPADVLIPVLSPITLALKRIHEKGLIHRDISPDNIMMLDDGSVCLIDFGNARDVKENRSMTLAMKQGFAAPEAYSSKGQGTYTDVYGLCATMYYCLTGKLPTQAMERLMGEPFLRPSEMGVAIEAQQEQAIMDGLELHIEKRIRTMEELWERLYTQASAPEEITSEETMPEESVAYEPIPTEEEVLMQQQTVSVPAAPQVKTVTAVTAPSVSAHEDILSLSLMRIRRICAQIYMKMKEL